MKSINSIIMNQFIAHFNWRNSKEDLSEDKGIYTNGIAYIHVKRNPVFKLGNKSSLYNRETKNLVTITGYLSNIPKICTQYQIKEAEDVEILEKLYSMNGISFIESLEGVFTIMIWDELRKKGYVFQDEFSSNLPLYYAAYDSELCISTSLKQILSRNIIKERKLNLAAVRDFMIEQNIVPNKKTFIKGIYKLTPGKLIIIDGRKRSFRIKRIQYNTQEVPLDYAKTQLMDAIGDSIQSNHAQLTKKERTCSLSGGYDSNTMLHYLSKVCNRITAITIGGKNKSEIPAATKLAEQYKNVTHNTAVVDNTKLNALPDIIWRNEGYVCELGLFLEYEMGKILMEQGVRELMSGEGADQILNHYRKRLQRWKIRLEINDYYNYIIKRQPWRERFRETKLFMLIRRPSIRISYDRELEYILKKSGILMNSYGIQQVYPFLSRRVNEISRSLGTLNNHKQYYISQLQHILGEQKMRYIKKEGGSTDIEYLLEGYKDLVLEILDDKFFRQIYSSKRMNIVKNDINKYSAKVLRFIFIYTFNKLFISRKFDTKLQDKDLRIDLKDLTSYQ